MKSPNPIVNSHSSRLFITWSPDHTSIREGIFSIRNGTFSLQLAKGNAFIEGAQVIIPAGEMPVVELILETSGSHYGPHAAVISWVSGQDSFAFLPYSVPADGRIHAPDLKVSIAHSLEMLGRPASNQTGSGLKRKVLPTGREIGLETWQRQNIAMVAPTVLGFTRDNRFFCIDLQEDSIQATKDILGTTVLYSLSRAMVPDSQMQRRLEDDCLPILHASRNLGGLTIEDTFFTTFGDRALTDETVKGTPLDLCHLYSFSATFPEGRVESARKLADIHHPDAEAVLFLRTTIFNSSDIPLIAPIRFPYPLQVNRATGRDGVYTGIKLETPQGDERLDEYGASWVGEVPFSLHRVNGEIPDSQQPCFLLAPGESMTLDSVLSHSQSGLSEAVRHGNIDWFEKFSEVKTFWKKRLEKGARVSVPDRRLCDLWKAGSIHLDLLALGEAESGPLLPKVGAYSAIGSESIPIVEFFDSIGRHDIAERCLDCFFEYQHANGRINIFFHYDVETGGALHMAGLHFAYTQDTGWIKRRKSSIKAAADYLIALRQSDPKAANYGLIMGNCADPKDAQTAFMLNAFNAAGLKAVARMLEAIGDSQAGYYQGIADDYAKLLERAIANTFGKSPLLPVGQDKWVPSCAPWMEGIGPQALGLQGEKCFSHRTYFIFDVLLSSLYAVWTGLIDPHDRMTQWMLDVNRQQYNRAAIGESQPYYSRHPEVHLLRGEREEFLNAFYSGISALADRETLTFWEHLYIVSKMSLHKTHEEAWALMQMRRMLWLEAGKELRLLSGIPESWLDADQVIRIQDAGSYFGSFSFCMERVANRVELTWQPTLHTPPDRLVVHLPKLNLSEKLPKTLRLVAPEWVEILNPTQPQKAQLTIL